MSARDDILGSIRKSLGREALSGEPAAQLRLQYNQQYQKLIQPS